MIRLASEDKRRTTQTIAMDNRRLHDGWALLIRQWCFHIPWGDLRFLSKTLRCPIAFLEKFVMGEPSMSSLAGEAAIRRYLQCQRLYHGLDPTMTATIFNDEIAAGQRRLLLWISAAVMISKVLESQTEIISIWVKKNTRLHSRRFVLSVPRPTIKWVVMSTVRWQKMLKRNHILLYMIWIRCVFSSIEMFSVHECFS